MICPAPYKGTRLQLLTLNRELLQLVPQRIIFSSDSLKEAEFYVQIVDGDRVTGTGVDRTFHERDSILDSNNFSGVEWRLNGRGNDARVRLIKGSAYICEIKVLTIPGESRSSTAENLFVT